MNVTDTAARARGEWRQANMKLCMDTLPLSECEQSLSNHERDAVRRDGHVNVTDTAAWARGEWRHADMKSCADTLPLSECEQPLSNHERDAGPVVTRRERRGHGGAGASQHSGAPT